MTEFFYGLGIAIVLIGLAWCGFVLTRTTGDSSGFILAKMMIMLPGVSVMGAGFLFLAVGGVLHRLDKIVQNTTR